MKNKKEIRKLLRFAKKIVKKEHYKKIKKIDDDGELIEVLKHSLVSALKVENYSIEDSIKQLERKNKDLFFIKNKIMLIPSKIKHFQVDFNEKDFYKLVSLVDDIKKEIENVGAV